MATIENIGAPKAVIPPLVVVCESCRKPYARVDVVEQSAEGPRIEFYQCQSDGCATNGKLAIIFEMSGGLAPAEPQFIEREVARRGAFFPSDYRPGGARRNW